MMETKKLNKLDKKMDKLAFDNRIKGYASTVISCCFMSLAGIYFYRSGKIKGIKEAFNVMDNMFMERKGEDNE